MGYTEKVEGKSNEPILIKLLKEAEIMKKTIKSMCVSKNYTYTPKIGCHKIYTNRKNWDDARKACQQDGADLAIVNSKEEEDVSFIRCCL